MIRGTRQLAGRIGNGRFRWLLRLFTLLAILSIHQIFPPVLQAQEQTQAYWRYSASRRISHVLNRDINLDGVDEFLIAAENGRVDMLNSVGNLQWSFPAGNVVQAINTLNSLESPQPEIALAVNRTLTLLDAAGSQLWSVELSTMEVPQPLLAFSSAAAGREWLKQYNVLVRQIEPFDYDGNGRDEILVLFSNGQLQLFDQNGRLIWTDNHNSFPLLNTEVFIEVADLNADGREEVAIGFFNPSLRFSQVRLIDGNQTDIWSQEQPISDRISALAAVPFGENGQLYLAVASAGGKIHLLDYNRQRVWWPRTLNKPITALTVSDFGQGPVLIAGTEVGVVVTYRANGSRLWTRRLAAEANRPVVSLTAAGPTTSENAPQLAVTLGPVPGTNGPNDVQLLGSSSRLLATYSAVDTNGLSSLQDMNRDGRYELLLVRFATIELLGLGVGTSEFAPEWSYTLDSEPGALLVVDFDQDGEEELLVGTKDGHLHYLNQQNNIDWLVSLGNQITHLDLLFGEQQTQIIVIRGETNIGSESLSLAQSWIDVRDVNGEQLWEELLEERITSLLVQDINDAGDPEIIIGTEKGSIYTFSATGTLLWQEHVLRDDQPEAPIQNLLLIEQLDNGEPLLIAVLDEQLYALQMKAFYLPRIIAHYDTPINAIFRLKQPGRELATRLLILTEGQISGLTGRGIQMPAWPVPLEGLPSISIPANDIIEDVFEETTAESFLIATDRAELLRLRVENSQPNVLWRLIGLNNITSLYWGDLNGDALPEIIVGNSEASEGQIFLYSHRPELIDEIPLSSGVFDLTVLQRTGQQNANLIAVTENGVVQGFRAKENRPPLLASPQVDGEYNFSVFVADVEGDEVAVRLEIFNPASGLWESQGTEIVANGNDRLFWAVSEPPIADNSVLYRFYYNDGAYEGELTPQPSPAATANGGFLGLTLNMLIFAGLLATTTVFLLVRQTQLPAVRARRFYRRLSSQPEHTLALLETVYSSTNASQDFLLYLASQARQREDSLVSSLADGLYLLADRPLVGLPIINGALDDARQKRPAWEQLERWQTIFATGQALLEAPTITEISLLRPQLRHLLNYLERQNFGYSVLDDLLPILTNLRDSERVDSPEDRLIYLNEANRLLLELQQKLPEFSARIEKTLVEALVQRWHGLVSAAGEELRGQAELTVHLKTKRIVPSEQTQVSLVIRNIGRAPAENVIAMLDDNPGYAVQSGPQHIALLPSGRDRQVTFQLAPRVTDRFRLGMTVSFNDRNQRNRQLAFGDMVHLLLPTRDFKPISNPYLPGTPLRGNSRLFYGREQLFSFIADNAGGWSQRNVLILIGQRRTGKTSTLLRLGHHLPEDLLPVYIDCQSLGVSPGMGALFHDLAWLISDALGVRNLHIEVPGPSAWQTDPTGQFQRNFIPAVKALLPTGTTLLLVFDEFEAFENLVEDGILPPTFFSFMRHLMQHSEGLSFIFVGTRRLEEMSADYWSVLFNIALYERITYLSEEAAIRLITEPVAPDLIYDDLAIDKILRVTAGHPYFVQLVCYALVKRANEERTGYVTISDVNATLDEMLSLGEVHFAYLWQRSTQAERVVLTAVAHMTNGDNPLHPEDILYFLEPFGLHLPPNEITAALIRLVQRGIMREVTDVANTLYELKIGLVGLWTAQHKSLSKLHAAPKNGAAAKKHLPSRRP